MTKMTYIRAWMLANLFLLSQFMLLVHVSSHNLHANESQVCSICSVADSDANAIPSDSYQDNGLVYRLIRFNKEIYQSKIFAFIAKSPLPRSPPFLLSFYS